MNRVTVASLWLLLLAMLNGCGNPAVPERMITEKITVNASVDDVWNAWTTSDGIKTFFAPDANVEARVGGAFAIYIDPSAPSGMKGADDMVFLAVQDKRMLSFTWNAPPSLPEARKQRTVVVVRFVSRGDTLTDVTINHMGWGEPTADSEWGKAYDYFAKSWPNVLKNLKKRFDSGPVDWRPWLEYLQKQRTAPTTSTADNKTAKTKLVE
ncbi:MAG: SRPBCC domain-containing protein [Rhodocyclaceae bacterium]|nr:SRPBCC domain-containing protein [Rhodocyclaceae bacterium]